MSSNASLSKADYKKEEEQRLRLQAEQEYEQRQKELQNYLIKRDYHQLTSVHKALIIGLFLSLCFFLSLLMMSYIPSLKGYVHQLFEFLL